MIQPSYRRIVFAVTTMLLAAVHPAAAQDVQAGDSVRFYGLTDQALFAGGVVVPAGRTLVITSGITPPVFNERADPGTRERYGDTQIQAAGALRRIEEQLTALGLTMRDVIQVRAFLAPDPLTGQIDVQGWNSAFAEFFGTDNNPTRPARTTVGVLALTNPDWLVEIEAVAVYPE